MKRIRSTVIFVTIFLVIHTVFTQLVVVPEAISWLLWMMGSAMVIYLVIVVLKFGEADDREWNDGYWYSDKERITDPVRSASDEQDFPL